MSGRFNQIRINLSDEEIAQLRKFAAAAGKSPAIAARFIILEVLEDDARAEGGNELDRSIYA